MADCMTDYVTGPYSAIMFSETLESNPRFAYVPQFYENTLGNGNSWLHIKRFKAIFLQGTWWKKGNTTLAFHPGEICAGCNANNYSMLQLSGFIMPNSALPARVTSGPAARWWLRPRTTTSSSGTDPGVPARTLSERS